MLTVALVHTVVTWFMIGVITYVQFVHYPMFRHWPADRFGEIEAEHQRRTARVVVLPMLAELLTGGWLLLESDNDWRWSVLLLLPIWLLTFARMVPLHERLRMQGFDERTLQRLLRWNAVRTLLWCLRGPASILMVLARP